MCSLQNKPRDNDVLAGSTQSHTLRTVSMRMYIREDWEDKKEELDTTGTQASDNPTVI